MATSRWVDVNEDDWFFNEVMEASSILLEDGEPFVKGILYSNFMTGAPYVYEEQKVDTTGKKVFTIADKVTPTEANPLLVFIDGTQAAIKSTKDNSSGTTDVELYSSPSKGSVVSFCMVGKPLLDRFGKPQTGTQSVTYPHKKLDYGDTYHYEPFSRQNVEYLYAYGMVLKRVTVPEDEWTYNSANFIAGKYIGTKTDVYIVSPASSGGIIYVPYNLNGVTCKFTYNSMENGVVKKRGGEFKPTATNVLYNNRFFPNAYITRGEAFLLLDRLRQTFYSRFTDKEAPTNNFSQTIVAYNGQSAFLLDSIFTEKTKLIVKVDGVVKFEGTDYTLPNDHSVLFKRPITGGKEVVFNFKKLESERFYDVGKVSRIYNRDTGQIIEVNGSLADNGVDKPSWWAIPVISMEMEKMANGDYLIEGKDLNNFNGAVAHAAVVNDMYDPVYSNDPNAPKERWFLPQSLLTRAEAVTFLNRFRKWSIERFR